MPFFSLPIVYFISAMRFFRPVLFVVSVLSLMSTGACQPPPEPWTLEAATTRLNQGDRAGARQLLEQAPDSSTQAKILLASLLLQEDGDRAFRLLDSAAQQGSAHALYLSGYWQLSSPGGDSVSAYARIVEAARKENPAAQGYLWTVYRDGWHGVAANADSALYWLHRAAAQRDSFAVRDVRALPDSLRARYDSLSKP